MLRDTAFTPESNSNNYSQSWVEERVSFDEKGEEINLEDLDNEIWNLLYESELGEYMGLSQDEITTSIANGMLPPGMKLKDIIMYVKSSKSV